MPGIFSYVSIDGWRVGNLQLQQKLETNKLIMSSKKQRSAAITGAGSGLGREIALGLAAKGYRVFGTAIANGEIADLQQASGGKVALSICDITDEKSVQAGLAACPILLVKPASTFSSAMLAFSPRGRLKFCRLPLSGANLRSMSSAPCQSLT